MQGASAAAHQLYYLKRNYSVCFGCQQHQKIEQSPPSNCKKARSLEIVPENDCQLHCQTKL